MPKPLRLFIPQPYTQPEPWTVVRGYGSPGIPFVFQSHLLLQTTGGGGLLAASDGRLSVRPPAGGRLGATDEIESSGAYNILQTSITLYLHFSPNVTQDAAFRAQAARIWGDNPTIDDLLWRSITGFAYRNVEVASLEGALAELLEISLFPFADSSSRAYILDLFLKGNLDIPVTAGHAIGVASTVGAPPESRQVGFAALTRSGPVDPSHFYDVMRDFVEDGQAAVDGFLALAPKRWPIIDRSIDTATAIQLTAKRRYSMPVLQDLKQNHNVARAQWRQVGNNQKQLYRQQLLRRVGHAPAGSTAPPFEFDDTDWQNIFQLEAMVEFYANFDDPWKAGAAPRNPGEDGYITVDFLDLEGTAATVNGNVVTLDGDPDLDRVWVNKDTLYLEDDTNPDRPTKLYRINAKNTAAGTVTLDASPVLSGAISAWKLRQRPILVLVDCFGTRIKGAAATISTGAPLNVLELDGSPDLQKVNINFDTVYLSSDTARPSRTYRIIDRDPTAHTVTLDGNPTLADGLSAWQIPAGLSGELPSPDYDLGPGATAGYDHYDGMMFVVQDGAVHERVRFGSYTSRNHPQNSQSLSSVRGNCRYQISSFHSVGSAFRNYCFKVVDPDATYDGVREARFYFGAQVTEDRAIPPTVPSVLGKTAIRIHYGNTTHPAGGSGSAGCLVSHLFCNVRTTLIERFQVDAPLGPDAEIQKAANLDINQSKLLHTGDLPISLDAAGWNDKIFGTLWLIRPDERPLS